MININKKAVGIDISDHAIQMVELFNDGGKTEIRTCGRKNIQPGIVRKGRIADFKELSRLFQALVAEAKPPLDLKDKNIYAALPESQVFMEISQIGPESGEETKKNVNKIIASTFPINIKELSYTYKILNFFQAEKYNPGNNFNTLLIIAVRKKIIREWENFFSHLNLKIRLFDFEALATFRALFSNWPEKAVGALGIGASSSNFTIFTNRGIAYAYTFPQAGDYFTKKIAEKLNIDIKKAEKLKLENGLSENKSKTAAAALQQGLSELFNEIEVNINFFNRQNSLKLEKVLVYGGSSHIIGLEKFFSRLDCGYKLEIAQPRIGEDNLSQEYIGAIGLALRGIEDKWSDVDPCLKPKNEKALVFTRYFDVFKNKIIILKVIFVLMLITAILFVLLLINHPEEAKDDIINIPVQNVNIPVQNSASNSGQKANSLQEDVKIRIIDIRSGLNIRSGPGTQHAVIGKANPNDIFILLSEKDNWSQIEYDGRAGWIFSQFSEKILD